ncbi:tRNA (N6-threonylcarbamoyladenosine(37)-N6)-methyltransferase TrmO [Tateyamaria omphalii]|uniref:TrmO family methyltransferase domain-containing protein n=1 Tax=Tateyamaria omphalii TaxID=299262 RepID=UPI00167259CE|nr:TrmO family methyltransferase [Tateyamaria omphalii]GGX37777.1 tRNA (N6-threonylcarbamoyladenosine(37)-N6)-methyltransferase TrmO [Tateyamaria omphalii]
MSSTYKLNPIGQCEMIDGQFAVRLTPNVRLGLKGLHGFSHAIALWWAHETDSQEQRARLTIMSPYTSASGELGVFSTRSEARPNPIGLSVFSIASIDLEAGIVFSHYFDMLPETPILDLKPYFPASDRVENASVPDHFSHWPNSLEASAGFDWEKEFTA